MPAMQPKEDYSYDSLSGTKTKDSCSPRMPWRKNTWLTKSGYFVPRHHEMGFRQPERLHLFMGKATESGKQLICSTVMQQVVHKHTYANPQRLRRFPRPGMGESQIVSTPRMSSSSKSSAKAFIASKRTVADNANLLNPCHRYLWFWHGQVSALSADNMLQASILYCSFA